MGLDVNQAGSVVPLGAATNSAPQWDRHDFSGGMKTRLFCGAAGSGCSLSGRLVRMTLGAGVGAPPAPLVLLNYHD